MVKMLEQFFQKCFPRLYRTHEKRFSEISKIGYVSLDDYKQDILDIDNEIKEINLTIEYYIRYKNDAPNQRYDDLTIDCLGTFIKIYEFVFSNASSKL